MLTDLEKNQLAEQYTYIVRHLAYKHRYLDSDIEEVMGWGFLGLAKAINAYEKNPDISFQSQAYPIVKAEMYNNCRQRESSKAIVSLSSEVNSNGEYALEEFIATVTLDISEDSIYELVRGSIRKMKKQDQLIIEEMLLNDKELDEISEEFGISKAYASRIRRRGIALVTKYLDDNDIVDVAAHSEKNKYIKKKSAIPGIVEKDYGKLKYLQVAFPELSIDDIAKVLNVNFASLQQLYLIMPIGYRKASLDSSIQNNAYEYVKAKYPERLPGELKIIV